MKCPFCGHLEDKVIDSRAAGTGEVIRRRRECEACARRFTTYERVEDVLPTVVKKDGRREPFDRQKLVRGLRIACNKRPTHCKKSPRCFRQVRSPSFQIRFGSRRVRLSTLRIPRCVMPVCFSPRGSWPWRSSLHR